MSAFVWDFLSIFYSGLIAVGEATLLHYKSKKTIRVSSWTSNVAGDRKQWQDYIYCPEVVLKFQSTMNYLPGDGG